jgi:DNA-binding MarR family transcriptional regulator
MVVRPPIASTLNAGIPMAIKLLLKVWKVPLRGNYKLVLMALADYADKDTHVCFPSVGKIAEKCGLSEHTIIRATDYLENHGYLFRKRRFNSSNVYKIMIE